MKESFANYFKKKRLTLLVLAILGFFNTTIYKIFNLNDSWKNIILVNLSSLLFFIIIYKLWIEKKENIHLKEDEQ